MNIMSTVKIGKEGEFRFASEFIRRKWNVFMPLNEDTPVDLLICKEDVLKKVQVKTTKPNNGRLKVKIRSTNNWQDKKYTKKDIDLIGVYDYINKEGYLLDMEECDGMSIVTLRTQPAKNNQKINIRNKENYVFFK